jgi:hypothetical protein
MRVDDALLSRVSVQYNIETDEPRGKTRCYADGCACLTYRPAEARAKAAGQR